MEINLRWAGNLLTFKSAHKSLTGQLLIEKNMKNSDYIKLISGLPLPSKEQTRNFAEYVSSAHSWYKHLPLYPASPFSFFLDPNAGRQTMLRGGGVTYIDVTGKSERFHHSTKTTRVYRSQFGYWNYFAPRGTSFVVRTREGVLDTRSITGPAILDAMDASVSIPDELLTSGTAGITCLVYPNAPLQHFWAVHPDKSGRRIEFPKIWEIKLETDPEALRHALAPELNDYYREKANGGAKEMQPETGEDTVAQARAMIEMRKKIGTILEQARRSQLESMERAMNEFVRLVNLNTPAPR